MGSRKWLKFIPKILILHLVVLASGQPICGKNGNYSSNSTYHDNVRTLLSSLPSHIASSGFYNGSLGQNRNQVNAIAQCRGDAAPDICVNCLTNAISAVLRSCPVEKDAIVWDELCMVRYSEDSVFGTLASYPTSCLCNMENVTNPWQFRSQLRMLLRSLRGKAGSGDSFGKFASGNTSMDGILTIYALLQCTPDLSGKECDDCLVEAAEDISRCCDGKVGASILKPSCSIRFEPRLFYNAAVFDAMQREFLPPEKNHRRTRQIIIIVVVPLACFLLTFCIGILLIRRSRQKNEKLEMNDSNSGTKSFQFDFVTIRAATDDFSDSNKLGQSGFGAVYRGKFPGGQDIAVKRLSTGSGRDDLEFENEVLLVTGIQQQNLVRVLGFSIQGMERLLVYEFAQNASLDHFIFDPIKRQLLGWDKLQKIIGGTARGLVYLHQNRQFQVIHHNIKAENILLDENMNPKISDFIVARLFKVVESHSNSSRILRANGYIAPESAKHGRFSVKSDVYSFGVLILEIISGKKVNSSWTEKNAENLLSFAWRNWQKGTVSNVLDSVLSASSCFLPDIVRCIQIALLCVQENPADRPMMASVIHMLNDFSLSLPIPSKPGFYVPRHFSPGVPLFQEHNSQAANKSSDRQSVRSAHEGPISKIYPEVHIL